MISILIEFNMKKFKLLKASVITFISMPLSVIPCFSLSSCSEKAYSIDASDWEGVVDGRFYPDSYTVNTKNKTVTYNDATGVRFLRLVLPNYVNYHGHHYKVLLGPKCFSENLWLAESIELNDFIDTIPDECFYCCHNLNDVIFHRYPKNIGNFAFSETPCTTIHVKTNGRIDDKWYIYLQSIGGWAFYKSWISGDIIFSKDLRHLGQFAFAECSNLQNVNMQYVIGLYTIQKATFEGCSSLTSVHIPSSLTAIGDEAFQMCTGLQKIYVPRDGMSISLGNDAFYSCNVLQDFSRDIEFTSIGDRCFWQNTDLKIQPWLPKFNTHSIGIDAFASCSISSISFDPNVIVNVDNTAFAYCTNLRCIDFSKYTPNIGAPKWTGRGIFNNVSESGTIYVAHNFAFSDDWKSFFDKSGLVIDQHSWKIIEVAQEGDNNE